LDARANAADKALANIIVARSGSRVIEHGVEAFKAQCQAITDGLEGKEELKASLLDLARDVCDEGIFDKILVEATSTAYAKLVCFTFRPVCDE